MRQIQFDCTQAVTSDKKHTGEVTLFEWTCIVFSDPFISALICVAILFWYLTFKLLQPLLMWCLIGKLGEACHSMLNCDTYWRSYLQLLGWSFYLLHMLTHGKILLHLPKPLEIGLAATQILLRCLYWLW